MLKTSTLTHIVEAAKREVSPFEFGNADIRLSGFNSLKKYSKFKKLTIFNDKIALLDSNGIVFIGTLNGSEITINREIKSNEILGPVTAFKFSLNNKLFAIGYNSGAIKVFNTDKGTLRYQCSPVLHRRGILDLQFTDESIFILDNSGTVCSFSKKEYSANSRKFHHDGTSEAAFSLNTMSKFGAWATSNTLYIKGDQYFGEIQVPLAHINDKNISLPFISIIEYDNNAVIYTAVNKYLTLTKISTLNEVISLQAQGSIDFENELINVKCLESVKFHSDQIAVVLVLDVLEKIYLVCGDIILWYTDIGALKISYDLHYFENISLEDSSRLKSKGRLTLCTHSIFASQRVLYILGDNNTIHTIRVPNIFHFVQTINTRLPKVLSLEYALYSGSRIQLVENTVIDLMHAAINEVYHQALHESRTKSNQNGVVPAGINHFSTMQPVIKKCVDLCLSTTWYSNRSAEKRQQLINEIFYSTPLHARNLFFKALEESASKIEFSWISPELCNVFLEYLESIKNFDLLEHVICNMPFEALNLDRTIKICKKHYLWHGLTHICDAMGDTDTVLSSMIKAIKQGNIKTKEALFEYLGNSLGFTGEVYEEGVIKTLIWLCEKKTDDEENLHYPNIEFLLEIDTVGFCQILNLVASNTQIKSENFNILWKILLYLIQQENYKEIGSHVIEMICGVFEKRKLFPDIFVKDVINVMVYLFSSTNYCCDSSSPSSSTYSCFIYLINAISIPDLEPLYEASKKTNRLMITALIAFYRENFNECLGIFSSNLFIFNLHSFNLLDKALTVLTPTVNEGHFQQLEIILNRIVKTYLDETINLCMSHAWILNHVPLRYELIMSMLQKYKSDSNFTSFLTNEFVKRVFDETLSKFSENLFEADEILSNIFNCYKPENIIVGQIAAENDYCLNKASIHDLHETYIHLSFGRKLPEQGFSGILEFVKISSFEHLFERLKAFLYYMDMFNDLTIENEWMLKLLQVVYDRLEEDEEKYSKKDLIDCISIIYTTILLMGSPQHHLQKALEICYQNEKFPRSDFSMLLNKTLTIYATRLTDHSELLRLIELEGIVHLLKSVDSATKGYSKEIIPFGRCTICCQPITESFMIVQDKETITHSECFKMNKNSEATR